MVAPAGFEPARPFGRYGLSVVRLPRFHHGAINIDMNKKRLLDLAGITLLTEDMRTQMNVATIVSLVREIGDRDALTRIQHVVNEQMDSISSR